jgi:predicted O-methyltransferase YrrM
MLPKRIRSAVIGKLMPCPVQARHSEYSMIYSIDDDISQPSKYLISVALEAIKNALEISLEDISARMKTPPYYPNIYPSEHYKLLAGLVLTLRPNVVVEIGTSGGLSALSMKKFLLSESKMITFDIVDWKSIPGSCFQEDDFKDGKLVQYIDDLSNPSIFPKYHRLLQEANMIFIDVVHDGIMEQRILDNFKTISFSTNPLIIFDDIRLWNMLKFWRNIALPKLDVTSFGHWSGTGIIEWK